MRYFISYSGEKTCISREKTKINNLESLNGFPELYEARKDSNNVKSTSSSFLKTNPTFYINQKDFNIFGNI